MNTTTLKTIADEHKLSLRRLQTLCAQGRIPGARLLGRLWMIPQDFTVTPGKRGPKLGSHPWKTD